MGYKQIILMALLLGPHYFNFLSVENHFKWDLKWGPLQSVSKFIIPSALNS